jgi:hypothetical protein
MYNVLLVLNARSYPNMTFYRNESIISTRLFLIWKKAPRSEPDREFARSNFGTSDELFGNDPDLAEGRFSIILTWILI